jgi:hypothetical protein
MIVITMRRNTGIRNRMLEGCLPASAPGGSGVSVADVVAEALEDEGDDSVDWEEAPDLVG